MATRTMRDYNLTFINDFCKSGTHDEIALNGLGADEIGEIILQACNGVVKSVSPEIVRVFQKRTGGNPLYVKYVFVEYVLFYDLANSKKEYGYCFERFQPCHSDGWRTYHEQQ